MDLTSTLYRTPGIKKITIHLSQTKLTPFRNTEFTSLPLLPVIYGRPLLAAQLEAISTELQSLFAARLEEVFRSLHDLVVAVQGWTDQVSGRQSSSAGRA
jgi:hypothetical protein